MSSKKKIVEALTQEEVSEYFCPLEDDFLKVAKVISYITQIPLSDINDTGKYYNAVKKCLKDNGFPTKSRYYPVFLNNLMKARESYLV